MEKYYQEMKRLAQTLWMLVGKAMGVDEVSGFQEPPSESVMRLLRYPAANARGVEGYSASQLRMAPHTDIGPITILPADPSESLEYWTSKGELACTHGHHLGVNGEGWQRIAYSANTFLVHLGDCVDFWTNGAWPSQWHRVSQPIEAPRFSMPFFIRVNPDIPMEVLPRYARQRGTLMDHTNTKNVNDLRQEDVDTMTEAEQVIAGQEVSAKKQKRNHSDCAMLSEATTSVGGQAVSGTTARNGMSGYPDYHGSKMGDFVVFKANGGFFERGPSADASAEEFKAAFQRVPSSVH
eukprot:scaffold1931_cov390-Prasinococcus_capsulatus_cf.AAC.2